MSFYPDLGRETMVAKGDHVRAVGWLHPGHDFTEGAVSGEFLGRLKEFAARSVPSSKALLFDFFFGPHICEFCNKFFGIYNFGVPSGDILYVAPEMIVHYVEELGYRPPDAFVEAVLRSPLPDTEAYRSLVERFRPQGRVA